MQKELQLFHEWFLEKYLFLSVPADELKKLNHFFENLINEILMQPLVFMHRDYQSANLFVLPENQIGLIDFQDACLGPITYDLVSLLRDCYIAWPDHKIQQWVFNFYKKLPQPTLFTAEKFLYYFDLTGLQRHLKALMIFSRKCCRDQNTNYLKHIPRTLNYILKISQKYSLSRDFFNFLQQNVVEKCEA